VSFYLKKIHKLPALKSSLAFLADVLPQAPLISAALCLLTPHPDLVGALWTAAIATVLRLPMPVELLATGGYVASPLVDMDMDVDETLIACPKVTQQERVRVLDILKFACSQAANTALAVRVRSLCTKLILESIITLFTA
jgi:hypothetical protein